MLGEKADLYYTLSFSSVHKHKVLLVYAVGYRRVEKERSANNQVVVTEEIPKREKDETKENEQENMFLIIVCQKRTAYPEQRK
jgi:hypothetical protein